MEQECNGWSKFVDGGIYLCRMVQMEVLKNKRV